MTYKNLIYEIVEKVGIIKVNRPEVRSVFNWETWMGFEDTLKRLHFDPNLRVVNWEGTWALRPSLKKYNLQMKRMAANKTNLNN
jgi:1,4-dihydroxy-2-naphthoyl-CoA synthase